MQSSKIKNIILLMLVLVNAFLLALVGLRGWRSREAQRESRQRMVEVLARSGVEYLPQEVPGELTLSPRQALAAPLDEAAAALLLDAPVRRSESRTRSEFSGPRGTAVSRSSGEVEAVFLPGCGLDEAAALRLLLDQGVSFRETAREEEGGRLTIRGFQLWEGVALPQAGVTVTLRDGELESLTFRRLIPGEDPAPSQESCVTASTALTRFLEELDRGGYVCFQVREMYPGYTLSGSAAVRLTPCWFIETDAWPWRFAVDGATGAVETEIAG